MYYHVNIFYYFTEIEKTNNVLAMICHLIYILGLILLLSLIGQLPFSFPYPPTLPECSPMSSSVNKIITVGQLIS